MREKKKKERKEVKKKYSQKFIKERGQQRLSNEKENRKKVHDTMAWLVTTFGWWSLFKKIKPKKYIFWAFISSFFTIL